MLEKLDEVLFRDRDRKKYRYKIKREKTIQTIMEDSTFSRRYYINRYTCRGIFLLDQTLDLGLIIRTRQNLIEKMIDNATDNFYRKGALKIEESTLTKVSHHGLVQK
ncbi:UPF0236 family transposase-like protein [Clostridium sp. BJN0013]|uniref:UPF0236 family transposase-like protein n=1 Tax=Clostridium sp. BJN0013 TaxID=3236840 RepID=UPI0034C62BC6